MNRKSWQVGLSQNKDWPEAKKVQTFQNWGKYAFLKTHFATVTSKNCVQKNHCIFFLNLPTTCKFVFGTARWNTQYTQGQVIRLHRDFVPCHESTAFIFLLGQILCGHTLSLFGCGHARKKKGSKKLIGRLQHYSLDELCLQQPF